MHEMQAMRPNTHICTHVSGQVIVHRHGASYFEVETNQNLGDYRIAFRLKEFTHLAEFLTYIFIFAVTSALGEIFLLGYA